MKELILKILKRLVILLLVGILMVAFFMYGPITYFRETWVTTAMNTLNHQNLATDWFTEKEITRIMATNKVVPTTEIINEALIQMSLEDFSDKDINIQDEANPPTDNTSELKNENKEQEMLEAEAEERAKAEADAKAIETKRINSEKLRAYQEWLSEITHIEIKGTGYVGHLLIVNDPSRVKTTTAENVGSYGEKLSSIVERNGAVAGINAGGFSDYNGHGNGGTPIGLGITNSEIYSGVPNQSYTFAGFNDDNILIVGTYNYDDMLALNLRDAVSFEPILVINGQPTEIIGNGGWGIQPRTVIGQRKDGSILLLAIDGRQTHSIGATVKDIQDIMIEYGAVNAINLDGGSSTAMYYEGGVINEPCGPAGERFLPNAIIVY